MSASQTTMDKLYGMRLSVMAQAYRDQEEMLGVADMTFDERFAMIVDAEWDSRRINKRTRLLRQAAFSDPEANVIDIRYDADRKLDKVKIAELANCEWVKAHRNVLITGASGAGKSWLACALGVAACNAFYSVRYAHARDARRAHRIQGRGMAQIEEALHEVRCADSRRLAAGEDRGRPGPRAARDSRVKAQDRLLDHLLPVLASRVARKVGRGRNCGCRD